MSSENFLDFLNSGDGCTILRTYKKIGIVYFIYLYFGWIIRYRNCILIKMLKENKTFAKKRKEKTKNLRKQIEENRWNICLRMGLSGEK